MAYQQVQCLFWEAVDSLDHHNIAVSKHATSGAHRTGGCPIALVNIHYAFYNTIILFSEVTSSNILLVGDN